MMGWEFPLGEIRICQVILRHCIVQHSLMDCLLINEMLEMAMNEVKSERDFV